MCWGGGLQTGRWNEKTVDPSVPRILPLSWDRGGRTNGSHEGEEGVLVDACPCCRPVRCRGNVRLPPSNADDDRLSIGEQVLEVRSKGSNRSTGVFPFWTNTGRVANSLVTFVDTGRSSKVQQWCWCMPHEVRFPCHGSRCPAN